MGHCCRTCTSRRAALYSSVPAAVVKAFASDRGTDKKNDAALHTEKKNGGKKNYETTQYIAMKA